MRHVLHVLGLGLDIIGIGGMSDDIATWGKWAAWLHAQVDSPFIAFPALILGTAILAYVYGSWIADHRIKQAGTIPLERQITDFSHWDAMLSFQVWQVAWLWRELEPRGQPSDGTPVYSTFQLIKQDLKLGIIPDKKRDKNKSWMGTGLTREELLAYAESRKERPKFLYPEMRSWLRRYWAWLMKPEDEF